MIHAVISFVSIAELCKGYYSAGDEGRKPRVYHKPAVRKSVLGVVSKLKSVTIKGYENCFVYRFSRLMAITL